MNTTLSTGTAAQRLRASQLAQSRIYFGRVYRASDPKWTGAERGITDTISNSAVSRRTVYGRALLGTISAYAETTGTSNEVLHLIQVLCEGPIDSIETVYFDGEEVAFDISGNVTGKYAGAAVVKKYLGAAGQVVDPTLEGASAIWTTDHKLTGIAYLYVKLTINLQVFTGIPAITAVVKGKADIYDPRTGLSGYSRNPALCLADYLTTPLTGPGIAYADLDANALAHAADVCDEVVATTTIAGTEPRYTCQGVIDSSETVEDNARRFVQAMAGDMIQQGGSFVINAGEYQVPTFTIDEDMLAGGIVFSSLQPRTARANIIKGTFQSEANAWQQFDFPSITDAAAVAMDGQEVISDVGFALVDSGAQAQRLANIQLRQARRGRTVQLQCNLKAMPVKVGSNVMLSLPRYFDGDVFKVMEWRWSAGNDGAPGITLTLMEANADIWAWDVAQERPINDPLALSVDPPQTGTTTITQFVVAMVKYFTISSPTAGAGIRYSFTADPKTSAGGTEYTGQVAYTGTPTLYSRAFRPGYLDGALRTTVLS
jgi:hypothetical protein